MHYPSGMTGEVFFASFSTPSFLAAALCRLASDHQRCFSFGSPRALVFFPVSLLLSLDSFHSFLRRVGLRVISMSLTSVPDNVALAFGSRDGFLLFASLTVYGSVPIGGPELHPLGFLTSSTSAAGKDAVLIGGRLHGPAWLALFFSLFLQLPGPFPLDDCPGSNSSN